MLTGNHNHLLVEPPEPNLVAGMKQVQRACTHAELGDWSQKHHGKWTVAHQPKE